jgi:hypothetical protein
MPNAIWRQRWLPLIVVGAVAIALALVMRPFQGHVPPPVTSPSQPRGIVIACLSQPGEPGYCDRYFADQSQRDQLTEAQRREATVLADPIRAAVDRLAHGRSRCVTETVNSPCRLVYDPIAVDDVRAAIARPDAIVRLARYDDPAPLGSVFYAVPMASACLIGHADSMGPGHAVVGHLPGGRCAVA